MQSFRFIHAADLHLDSQFHGLSTAPDGLAARIQQAGFRAFRRLIDHCLEHDVDFLLLAGDIFDSESASLWAQKCFRNEMQRLSQAGIQVYLVHGNHDPLGPWMAGFTWPQTVYQFPAGETSSVPVYNRRGDRICTITGVSYGQRNVRDDLSRSYQRPSDTPYAIGLLHSNVDGVGGHDDYAPSQLQALVGQGFNYWALGHVHRRRVLYRDDHCVVAYSGGIQGQSRRDLGEQGCYLVAVDANRSTSLDPLTTADVIWEAVDIEISEAENEQNLFHCIESELSRLAQLYADRGVLVELRLQGRSPMHGRLVQRDYQDTLLSAIQMDCTGFDGAFVYPYKLSLDVRERIDIDRLRQGDSFIADFLKAYKEIAGDPILLAQLETALAPLFSHRKARHFVPSVAELSLSQLMEEAKQLALDLMLGEES